MDRTRLNTKKSACVKTTAKVFSVIHVLLGSSTSKANALDVCVTDMRILVRMTGDVLVATTQWKTVQTQRIVTKISALNVKKPSWVTQSMISSATEKSAS